MPDHRTGTPENTATQRAARIIREAGYLSLATADTVGRPWVAQLQYAWFSLPLSVVVGSHIAARHSRDIAETGQAAATISTLPGSPNGLDGVQVAGACTALDGDELHAKAPDFYQQMFPNATEGSQIGLTPEQLQGDAPLRLYKLSIDELWILDLDRWALDQVSTRIRLDPDAVSVHLALE